MRRREFVAGAAAASPLAARATGVDAGCRFLSSRSPDEAAVHPAAFLRGLNEVGFIDGKNVSVSFR